MSVAVMRMPPAATSMKNACGSRVWKLSTSKKRGADGVGDVGRGADGGDGQASGEVALPTAPSLPFSVYAVKTVPTPTYSIACSSRTEESPPATAASTSPRRSAARVADVARVRRTRCRLHDVVPHALQKTALWRPTKPFVAKSDAVAVHLCHSADNRNA